MHVYSDPTGQKAVIVIVGDNTDEALPVLANRLLEQQRSRDPQLQVVTNKSIELKGHTLQQLDSIISAKGQTAYSSIVLGKVDNQLLTIQVTLPADNQQKRKPRLKTSSIRWLLSNLYDDGAASGSADGGRF